jgi:hypothetical protein
MDIVQGATIGSVQLDTAFENSARSRLETANRTVPTGFQPKELDDIAWEMAKSKEYQNAKCEYGSSDDDTEFFTVTISRFHRSYTNNHAGISYGEMTFRRNEIQGYFDAQIKKLFELIDKQLVRLQQKFPTEHVAHLVLSGGLGNSIYVQRCIRERYSFGRSPFPNALSIQVRVAPEPQLVVCKGIVADRIQKLKSGLSVLRWRCSRASYGTLCKIVYNPNNPDHFGKKGHKDLWDGKLYIDDWIDWFITQGDPVSIDCPIVHKFSRKCEPESQFNLRSHRSYQTTIVSSEMDRHMLPKVLNNSCQTVCEITSDFSTLPLTAFKLKNRHWWNRGRRYHRINYHIKVVLGPADIRFELWHNGQKFSEGNSIKVEWHAAQAPPVNSDAYQPRQQWQPGTTGHMANGSYSGPSRGQNFSQLRPELRWG